MRKPVSVPPPLDVYRNLPVGSTAAPCTAPGEENGDPVTGVSAPVAPSTEYTRTPPGPPCCDSATNRNLPAASIVIQSRLLRAAKGDPAAGVSAPLAAMLKTAIWPAPVAAT